MKWGYRDKQAEPRRTPAPNTAEESLFVTEMKVDLMREQGLSSHDAEIEAYRAIAIR